MLTTSTSMVDFMGRDEPLLEKAEASICSWQPPTSRWVNILAKHHLLVALGFP
jgi:hypothetical protein